MKSNQIVTTGGVSLTSTGTAVSALIAADGAGLQPVFIRVSATGNGAHVRVSDNAAPATLNSMLISPGDSQIMKVYGSSYISVISVSGTSVVSVSSLEDGGWGGAVAFAVQSLFAAGEQGAWYDPSDFSTLFQDAAGTTPVTAVGQPVGLMLDKRLRLVRGPELWVAPTIGTGWVDNGGGSYAFSSPTGVYSELGIPALPTNKTFRVTFTAAVVSNSVSLRQGAVVQGGSFATGTHTIFVTGAGGALVFTRFSGGSIAADFTVSNISVRELSGNHASQATAASRPVLSARVNLLTNTTFAGGLGGTPGSGAVAPSGWTFISSGGAVTFPTVNGEPCFRTTVANTAERPALGQGVNVSANTAHVLSASVVAVAVAGLLVSAVINFGGVSAGSTMSFRRNGATATGGEPVAVGDRIECILSVGATAGTVQARVGGGTGVVSTGDATFTAPQFETGSVATRYQRVNTATDYDTAGFPMYLAFDGVDDGMSTGSIDFTATDKMTLLAGVRKLSDAAVGLVAELTADASANNGGFAINAPATVASNYGFVMRGTAAAATRTATTYAAPVSNVLSASLDAAAVTVGTQIIPRINGVTPTLADSAASTAGTFANAIFYVGARAGTSLRFNGNIYSLIIRGAASTPAQVLSAESFVNSKTGAY